MHTTISWRASTITTRARVEPPELSPGVGGALGASLAAQFVPSTVYVDVVGKIVHFASSGKRLATSLTAVKPLFDKVFPNVTLEVVS